MDRVHSRLGARACARAHTPTFTFKLVRTLACTSEVIITYTSALHVYTYIYLWQYLHVIPAWLVLSRPSSFPHSYRENKLYIYALRPRRTYHYNYTFSVAASPRVTRNVSLPHPPTPSTTFSPKLSPASTYVQLRCIHIYAPRTRAAEASASYSASAFSYVPARWLRSPEWQAALTPKNKEKLRERLEGHVRGMLLQTTLQ